MVEKWKGRVKSPVPHRKDAKNAKKNGTRRITREEDRIKPEREIIRRFPGFLGL
jgi:hypothetical protein